MTLPEPVARHKSTLFLVFPPKCAPLAELACWHHCTSKPNIRIGLDSDLLSTAPKLIIPSGPMAPVRTVLSGKATIARYLARHDPLLYNESDDAIKLVTDTMLDTISFESDPKKIALHIAAYCKGKQGDTLGLADFYAWDYATHNPSGLEECLARWNEIKLLQNVKKQVADTLFAQPVLDEYKRVVAQQISKILNVPLNRVYESFLEPRDKNTADLSIAMPFFRLPGNPAQMAKDIASKYESCDLISNSSHTGIFVNFLFNRRKYYSQTLTQALTMAESYGTNTSALGNLAVVEFSSPNIAKPFHAGHLRSTIIGNFCKNILAANGCSTLSMNYLGDWGKQYGIQALFRFAGCWF